jgi:hypothetical protein
MLFVKKDFISHSGHPLQWKIDCDALSQDDIETLAWVIQSQRAFGSVYGIPAGGVRLAKALEKYCTQGPRLVVDDVLTTGKSLLEEYQEGDIGVVIFARGECPGWVRPIFATGGR